MTARMHVPSRTTQPPGHPWQSRLTRIGAVVQLLVGASAVVCGPLLVLTDGLGMSRQELDRTPFSTFLVPGIVLGVVVGGSLVAGGLALWKRTVRGPLLALFAGCTLLGWILVEMLWIDAGRPLQIAILACATVSVMLPGYLVLASLRHR